jgi:hypothetical protein
MDSEGLFQSSLLCRLTDRLPVRTVFRVAIQQCVSDVRWYNYGAVVSAQILKLPLEEPVTWSIWA